MTLTTITLSLLLAVACFASAGEKMSDAQIKQKLIGYWSSGHHAYYIASDGIAYMCPRKQATIKYPWDVRNGKLYWDGAPHSIITLSYDKVVYKEIGGEGRTFTLARRTKEQVDPE